MKFMRYIPDELLYLVAYGCFASAIVLQMYFDYNRVVVEFSNDKCVKVIYNNPDFDYNCQKLPDKYKSVYIGD